MSVSYCIVMFILPLGDQRRRLLRTIAVPQTRSPMVSALAAKDSRINEGMAVRITWLGAHTEPI